MIFNKHNYYNSDIYILYIYIYIYIVLEKREVYAAKILHPCETFLSIYFKGKIILHQNR